MPATSTSTMTYAEAIRAALAEELEADSRVVLLGEDIGVYGGAFGVTQGLLDQFGAERVRDTPISEEGIVGAAVGLALCGMLPVAEMQFSDFTANAMDQLVNQAAKLHFMLGGAVQVPLVLRLPAGSGTGAAAQHSQSQEAWYVHTPGLKVVMPSSPADAKGLLHSAAVPLLWSGTRARPARPARPGGGAARGPRPGDRCHRGDGAALAGSGGGAGR